MWRPALRAHCGHTAPTPLRTRSPTVKNIHNELRRNGLVRPREGRVLGGVIAGVGQRLGIDPWPARLLFLLLVLLPGSQLLIYPVLWILMPSEGTEAAESAAMRSPVAGPPVTAPPA